MIQTKFSFKSEAYHIVDVDWIGLKKAMLQIKNGEVLVRKRIEWDYDQMRKYLHGPVTKFMIEQFKSNCGIVYTNAGMHRWLRDEFLPGTPKEIGGKLVPNPVSSESIGRDGYVEWLNNINHWCMDTWQVQLPPPEKVE